MNHFHQETLNKSEKKQASWLAHVSLTLSRHTLQTIYNVNGGAFRILALLVHTKKAATLTTAIK